MTTLQATWSNVAQRAAKVRDTRRFWEIAHTVLGITVLVGLLAAGIAIRVLVYVRLP